ncbi:hypothetical protein EOE18_00580 [Novosphingobium umbonatum]|uniref:Histidine kinase n=1 Tax=Novosphingobium umbonatum TaxID=1908524 RepID=A0A3S2UUU9_9SPHN|nr:hypothetical protein [Novosphingobium umbonatum]RVU07619.1 hypothetical protein EOE18_00580 [Novosphingobium umbonatum]
MHRPLLDPALDRNPREVRAHMVQRLQVGLFGLSLMLLLVGLANVIMEQARRNDAAQAVSAKATSSGTSDPLADIGVVPSPEALSAKRAGAARSAP